MPTGSSWIARSSVLQPFGSEIREGALGCAPIHSSASGSGEGCGRPSSSAMAVREPQA